MTNEQSEKIKQARLEVLALTEKEEAIFDGLVKELGFETYMEKWADGSDPEELRGKNPVSWLYDMVFNNHYGDDRTEYLLERISTMKEAYDHYGNV